jgi:cytochrome c5
MHRASASLALLALLTGCERRPTPPAAPAPPTITIPARQADVALDAARIAAGREVALRFECNRCHATADLPVPPQEKHCVNCHIAIFAGELDEEYGEEVTRGWRARIVHLRQVPSLLGAARLERAWLIDYLQHPHDLRPRLPAMMPRLAVSPTDAAALADWLTGREASAQPRAAGGDAARGRALMGERGCMSCHSFTGSPTIPASAIPVTVEPEQLARAMALAPDLAQVRGRLRPLDLLAWLEDPSALKPDASMPRIPLTEAERVDIAAALLDTPLTPPATPMPERLPLLEREVSYEEVERRVFKKVCWHCHSDADFVEGDGGPGNTGGFGFKGRGVQLGDEVGVESGRLDDAGKRGSLFRPAPDGLPWLVSVMWARHAEVRGQVVPGVRGMPLGLTPMTLEEIQLVETWIAQRER